MTNRSDRTAQAIDRNYDIVFEKLREAVDSRDDIRMRDLNERELRAIDELRRFSSAVRDPLPGICTRS